MADDSAQSILYKNNHDGTFTDVGVEAGVAFSPDGKTQAGMRVSGADYLCEGNLSIVKTNFVGDVTSLYHNMGDMNFLDQAAEAGLGRTRASSDGEWGSWTLTTTAGPFTFTVTGEISVGSASVESLPPPVA